MAKGNFKKTLQRYYVRFSNNGNSPFKLGFAKQKAILERQDMPGSDLERSHHQYKCQMELLGKMKSFTINMLSIPFAIVEVFRPYRVPTSSCAESDASRAAIYIAQRSRTLIPQSLGNEFTSIVSVADTREYLTTNDRRTLISAWLKHPFSWHWLYKCAAKMAEYRYYMMMYKPACIIATCEFSFTSTFLTRFCEVNGVEHINVMHGDKLFNVRDSYFRFSRCYVWDLHYVNLFKSLRASEDQFIVEVPPSLRLESDEEIIPEFDITYYLGIGEKERLISIAGALRELDSRRMRIAVRPHPRYCDDELVKAVFGSFCVVEDITRIPIEVSVARTRMAASAYSTVLQQAYYSGIDVVIDDVSDPDEYYKLSELGYIMLAKEHSLLSELIGKNCEQKN